MDIMPQNGRQIVLFGSPIKPGDPEGIRRPAYVTKASSLHAAPHLLWRRELADRCWEVFIGATHAGNQSTHARQNVAKVEGIKLAHKSARFAEIEYADFPARFEHAKDLAQAGVIVGQIAEAEGGDNQIHFIFGNRKRQRVSLNGLNASRGIL